MSNFLFVKLVPLSFLLVKLILLIEIVACWFLYMEFLAWWFFCETYCILIFLLVKLVHRFFSTRNLFCSWNLLHVLFVELVACWFLLVKLVECWFFSSWNLYIDFTHCETDSIHRTCCVMNLLVELVVCWFLFEKLLAWWFSLRETFTLILLLVKVILFMELPACRFFIHGTSCLRIIIREFYSWNLLRN